VALDDVGREAVLSAKTEDELYRVLTTRRPIVRSAS